MAKTADRYEVLDADFGEGGFGKVSKQKDKVLDRLVAVKELQILEDDEARQRFEREARTLAKLSHPNVPAIYDVKFEKERMLIYFEFLEGKTLRAFIKEKTIPPMEKARRWFTQIAASLDHAHKLGITHRDIKPENIIISENHENAFLVDFGIALSKDDADKITKQGYVIGTPAYMSPEQKEGDSIDGRSDLYSLGLTLYEVLCGHLPHAGGYQDLAEYNESIPPAIDSLIRKCIANDPSQRVKDALEFISWLRSAFRTDAPLSSILTDARLHEIVAVLHTLSAEDFHGKPRGQKLLLINRMKDLVRVNKPELKSATAELIGLLVSLCRMEQKVDYEPIVASAFEWGFNQSYGHTTGDRDLREEIAAAAKEATGQAHEVISRHFVGFCENMDFRANPGWFNHDIRMIAMTLLANSSCGDVADALARIYDKVNDASHS